MPLPDDESGSEDDSSSLASLRTSIISPDKKGSVPGSPRAVKRGKDIQGKSNMDGIRTLNSLQSHSCMLSPTPILDLLSIF